MLSKRSATATVARLAALALFALLAALALVAAPARATIVLLGTSSGAPSPQDGNLYDWRGQWTSALDRAAPLPGQLPPWQVNVGLYGDWYVPPNSNVEEQNPTCQINLQIAGAPIVQKVLSPCVWGPRQGSAFGSTASPVPELLTPNLAAAGNGLHTVTITAYDVLGGVTSSTTFNAYVDNTLPSPTSMVGAVGWQRGGEVVSSTATTTGPSGIKGQSCAIGSATAGWYPGATAELAVAGNGQIPVLCTSENNAGVSGPVTQYNAAGQHLAHRFLRATEPQQSHSSQGRRRRFAVGGGGRPDPDPDRNRLAGAGEQLQRVYRAIDRGDPRRRPVA